MAQQRRPPTEVLTTILPIGELSGFSRNIKTVLFILKSPHPPPFGDFLA